ncbi:hypothetical protein N7G274_007041 [Stereocaulon virgatum]|uniref:Sm domain-containing protein n=1 Tax=Stereocaulon virgatum TaxID=373712 RepID=A0ABR4A398_9LECA
MDNTKAVGYLEALLNKKLRIYTDDTRMFLGDFKCTDNECNVILSQSYEYRPPTPSALKAAAQANTTSIASVKVDMTSRFLGLIVVPGQHIIKIEVEDP